MRVFVRVCTLKIWHRCPIICFGSCSLCCPRLPLCLLSLLVMPSPTLFASDRSCLTGPFCFLRFPPIDLRLLYKIPYHSLPPMFPLECLTHLSSPFSLLTHFIFKTSIPAFLGSVPPLPIWSLLPAAILPLLSPLQARHPLLLVISLSPAFMLNNSHPPGRQTNVFLLEPSM